MLALSIAVVVLAALNVWQFYAYVRVHRDLLDRLMARDPAEYRALAAARNAPPLRNRPAPSDKELYDREQARLAAAGGSGA